MRAVYVLSPSMKMLSLAKTSTHFSKALTDRESYCALVVECSRFDSSNLPHHGLLSKIFLRPEAI